MSDDPDSVPPNTDPSRFAVTKENIAPLTGGRSVDRLTDAERKDNAKHDKAVKSAK